MSDRTDEKARDDGCHYTMDHHYAMDYSDLRCGLCSPEVPEQTKGGCIYCPPFGMSSEDLPADGVHRCGYCGKRWRGQCTDKGTMWHEVTTPA
jgi:hypothetical protein